MLRNWEMMRHLFLMKLSEKSLTLNSLLAKFGYRAPFIKLEKEIQIKHARLLDWLLVKLRDLRFLKRTLIQKCNQLKLIDAERFKRSTQKLSHNYTKPGSVMLSLKLPLVKLTVLGLCFSLQWLKTNQKCRNSFGKHIQNLKQKMEKTEELKNYTKSCQKSHNMSKFGFRMLAGFSE